MRTLAALLMASLAVSCSGPGATSVSSPTAAAQTAATPTAAATITSFATTYLAVAAACTAPATVTPEQTEGPYFKAGAPQKASLVTDGMSGTRITLIGSVLTKGCRPVVDAKVDIWQADAKGSYDNSGYTLRGYVKTDANGQYRVDTIVPGEYPGRTPHIHVKVTPPGGSTLTTQLYFPSAVANARDDIFRPELLMQLLNTPSLTGAFVLIVDIP